MSERDRVSRRGFMKSAMAAGAAVGGLTILGATARGQGKTCRVGLIGCGGRGTGALAQHVEAAKLLNDKLNLGINIEVVATADWFQGRAEGAGKRYGVPKERCFGGPDNYRKLLEVPLDTVLMAQAPVFRPIHFEAVVEAGRNCFMEKPSGVDAPGCRRIIKAGEAAKKKGLLIVAGTQRRHEQGYNRWHAEVAQGAYGRLLGGRVSWCQGKIFSNTPINPKGPDDLVGGGKWQLWIEMSGDHICEQHVHNIDIMNWFMGGPPQSAVGFGFRARRVAGNMYDFFSIDYEYPGGVHVQSNCRQVGGCWDAVSEQFTYEKQKPNDFKLEEPVRYSEIPQQGGGHQQEHINMLYYLVKGKEINEAESVGASTATAIMGRDSAYTGQRITWEEMMANPNKKPEIYNRQLSPTAEDFEKGEVKLLKDGDNPIPGTA